MNYQRLKEEAFRALCRRCVNEAYGLTLRPEDCCYMPYPELCARCGQPRNIVEDIRPIRRWRLLPPRGGRARKINEE